MDICLTCIYYAALERSTFLQCGVLYLAHSTVVPMTMHEHQALQEAELRDREVSVVDRLAPFLPADADPNLPVHGTDDAART